MQKIKKKAKKVLFFVKYTVLTARFFGARITFGQQNL